MEPIIMFFGGLATKDSYFSTQKLQLTVNTIVCIFTNGI